MKLEEIVEKRNQEIELLQRNLKRQESLNQPTFPCTKCTKNFCSSLLLENHIRRKHPQVQESKDNDANLINTIKLELEIKKLKDRLNATEKELMDELMDKKIDCQQCKQNNQRKFQSIGVQSNFEEKEKDDFEKDAVAELLSNQMKNFEELKRIEETQINNLRSKLDETIAILIKRESIPSPAPRLIRNVDKTVGTSQSIESLTETKPQEDLWKSRCEKMEKIYEERMASTVTNIEQSYKDKMTSFEERMKELELEKLKFNDQLVTQSAKPKVQDEIVIQSPLSPKVVKKVHVAESSSSSSDSSLGEDEQPSEAASPPVFDFVKNSSVNKQTVQDPNPKPQTVQEPNLKPPALTQTFSGQKFFVKNSNRTKHKANEADKREKAENCFLRRLRSFGISKDQKQMSKQELVRIQSVLVDSRDEVKKKRKTFFKVRRQVLLNLDKTYELRETSKHNEEMQTKEAVKKTDGLNLTKIRQLDESYKKSATIQAKDEKLLKAETPKEIASTSKKAFLHKDLVTAQPTRDSEVSTKVKRKERKVEFDLGNEYKIHEIREEDDSDFDISSFTSEVEEIR